MPTQNVNLTNVQAQFIQERIKSGEYNNASEVVRDALRLLKERKDEYQARLDALRAELQKGFDDREHGRYIDLHSREDIHTLLQEIARKGRERLAK